LEREFCFYFYFDEQFNCSIKAETLMFKWWTWGWVRIVRNIQNWREDEMNWEFDLWNDESGNFLFLMIFWIDFLSNLILWHLEIWIFCQRSSRIESWWNDQDGEDDILWKSLRLTLSRRSRSDTRRIVLILWWNVWEYVPKSIRQWRIRYPVTDFNRWQFRIEKMRSGVSYVLGLTTFAPLKTVLSISENLCLT
jgi:hypothetical protein